MLAFPVSWRSLPWALTPWLRAAFACLVLTFGVLDVATTWLDQMAFPVSPEANPLVFWLQQGPLPVLLAVKLLALAVVYAFIVSEVRTHARSWAVLVFAASALCLLVAASNFLLFLTGQDLLSTLLS